MKQCVIFCAGEFDGLIQPFTGEEFVLAADGGLAHVQKLGICPQGILGDFDSLGYIPEDAKVFPVEKDDTDSMLAVRLGLERGFREFVLYGALDGPRLDHTIANLQTLCFLADRGARGHLVGKEHIVSVVKDGKLLFPPTATGIVSVFCMGENATGVCIQGLQYALENGVLSAHYPLGVSNHFIGKEATVQVRQGTLLAIYDRKNGLARVE